MIHIDIPKEKITASCRRRHIRWMACFGSAVRDDFGPDSDVDVLVEFAPDHTPGWEIEDIEEDLSTLFGGRKVDVVNPKYHNRRLKDRGCWPRRRCSMQKDDTIYLGKDLLRQVGRIAPLGDLIPE